MQGLSTEVSETESVSVRSLGWLCTPIMLEDYFGTPHLVDVHALLAVLVLQQHISHMQLQHHMQAGGQPVGLDSAKHLACGGEGQ